MEGPRVYQTEWGKSEREYKRHILINTCMWNLEKWYKWTYSQVRNRVTDIGNRQVDKGWGAGWLGRLGLTYVPYHVRNRQLATHSSVLAWRIPETAEPGGLRSLGSHRVGHDWSDAAAAAEAGKQTSPALPKLLQIARRPLLAFLPHYFPMASDYPSF